MIKTSLKMGFSILGFTCLILLFYTAQGEDPSCVQDVQGCAITFQMGVSQIGSSNITAICQEVNTFLECLDRVLQPCDLATRTSLLDAMNNLIDTYKKDPYNCVLSFADNFTVPECTLQIGACAAWDLQAEATNPLDACRYHTVFKTCMNENTTSCNSTDRVEIVQAIQNSTNRFTPCPFNCYGEYQCETTTLSTPPRPTTQPAIDVNSTTHDNETYPIDNNSTGYPNIYSTALPDINGTVDSNSSFPNGGSGSYNGTMVTTDSSLNYDNSTQNWEMSTRLSPGSNTTINVDEDNTTIIDEMSNVTTPVSSSDKPGVDRTESSGKPGDTVTNKPGDDVTTNEYPYQTDQTVDEVDQTNTSTHSTTVDYDSLGNNDAETITTSGLTVILFSLLSSLF